MSQLDDRLSESLGGAYRATFGSAPEVLPEPARGHGLAIAAGVGATALVATAVAVPLTLAHTGSGTTAPAAGRPAVLETGSPAATGTPACGPGDVKLTAYLNKTSFPESVLDQKQAHLGMFAFLAYGELSGTSASPCRSYDETASIGFISPAGHNVLFDPTPSCQAPTIRHNRTGAEPVIDPLSLACPPLPTVSDGMSGSVIRPTEVKNDYGVLLSSSGEVNLPGGALTGDAADTDAARLFAQLHEGEMVSPEPTFGEFRVDLANDPFIPASQLEVGTWKLRVTYGNLTAETPFEVTAG